MPLANDAVIGELARILAQLAQKKFNLEGARIDAILQRYLLFTERVTDDPCVDAVLPRCRDPDDQKFLELAYRGQAAALVTNDNKLLGLSRRVPFRILNAVKFASEYGASGRAR